MDVSLNKKRINVCKHIVKLAAKFQNVIYVLIYIYIYIYIYIIYLFI